MEKEKKKNFRPLAAERPAAAMFVLIFCPWNYDLPSEGSLHGPRFLLALRSSSLRVNISYGELYTHL